MKQISIIIFLLISKMLFAQKFISEKSNVTFFSEAPIENITAVNTKSSSAIDLSSGKVAFSIPIVYFEFDKSLMKEHFNKHYMESDKFPKAKFVGEIEGLDKSKPGKQSVTVKGKLTIHGKEHEITIEGSIEINENNIVIECEFFVKLKDYKIKIPQVVWQNIAEEIQVKIHFDYVPYN